MATHAYVVINDKVGSRQRARDYIDIAPEGTVMTIKDPDRTLDQNAAQWPYLEAFSKGLQWPVNGQMVWLSPDEWKAILTAAFEGETSPKLAAGWNGGVVMLGLRTSRFSKAKFGEWIEWLAAACAMKGLEPVYKSPPRG